MERSSESQSKCLDTFIAIEHCCDFCTLYESMVLMDWKYNLTPIMENFRSAALELTCNPVPISAMQCLLAYSGWPSSGDRGCTRRRFSFVMHSSLYSCNNQARSRYSYKVESFKFHEPPILRDRLNVFAVFGAINEMSRSYRCFWANVGFGFKREREVGEGQRARES